MTVRDLLPAEVKTLSELIGTVVCIMGIGLILFAVWYNEYIMVLVAAAIAGVGVIMLCFADGEPMKCPECGSEMAFMTVAFSTDKNGIGRHFWLCQLISGGCGHSEKVKR